MKLKNNVLDQVILMGAGNNNEEQNIMVKILDNLGNWFKENMVKPSQIEVDGKNIITFMMNDNTMEPMIRHGDSLNFEPQNVVNCDGIYLFKVNGFYKVRNLRRTEYTSFKVFKVKAVEISTLNPDNIRNNLISVKDIHVLGKLI